MPALTIGMATYNDFEGVYFTVQALRMYQDLADTELLVVDNYGCEHTKGFIENWVKARYVRATEVVGTAAAKNIVLQEARGDAVLCLDSHIQLAPNAIARLKTYYREHPDCNDLLQGPLVYDDLTSISTHFEPVWRGQMWGIWETDPRGIDPEGEPFEIWGQGMGVFSCRRSVWPGFNPAFRGFGWEEGYIHEKIRRAGGRCLCLPWLRWVHRFTRPGGQPYPLYVEDKLRNYLIGHFELGLDPTPALEHFAEFLSPEKIAQVQEEALGLGVSGPLVSAGVTVPDGVPLPPAEDKQPAPEAIGGEAAIAFNPVLMAATQILAESDLSKPYRRAIVCFVDDAPHLIQQFLALRLSWLEVQSPDTDLVAMGTPEVLARLPDDLVKIEQRPATDDPVWRDYRFINSIACMNGAGAEVLDRYDHLLRSDVNTFITPAWNQFYPEEFTFATGAHVNDDETREKIRNIAHVYRLIYRGVSNIHTTWYGPTDIVRRASAFSEMFTKHLLNHHFARYEGTWPGWFRGVASLYAGEIAVNHCAPDAQRSDLLDVPSTSAESISRFPHIRNWHTDDQLSKSRFVDGGYGPADFEDLNINTVDFANLDTNIIRDYCMALSLRSREQMELHVRG